MKLRHWIMLSWLTIFLASAFGARKRGNLCFLGKMMKKAYYGYDPFIVQGLITGTLYAAVDGYLTGMICEYFMNRKKGCPAKE
ncbi:MAG: hypothetical protein PHW04_17250 [Candidatus Wallbacteria bacterium]|nr:hypothetical protein [Candidatus Wallbacteria bacterium]